MKASPRAVALGKSIKKLVGVEADTKISPMSAYSSGVFLSGGTLYMIGNYFSDYLHYVEGLQPKQASLVITIALLFDAITDPVMGVITDRTRSPQGRHRPYIKWGILPCALTYFMLWSSFGLSSAGGARSVMAYYIIVYSLFRGAYTVVSVPHAAMLPEIAPGYSLRTQYNALKTVFDAVASYSGLVIAMIFFGFFTTETFSADSRGTFMLLGAVLSLWYTLPLIYTYRGTSEQSSVDIPSKPVNLRMLLSQYTGIFRNRAFRQYFLMLVMNTMSTSFASNSLYHFLRIVARREDMKNLLITVSGVGEAAGFVPAYAMSIRGSKQLPARVLMPLMIFALGLSFLVKPGVSVLLLGAIELLYGLALAGMASVTSNIFPDVTDVDCLITGERREGVISAVSTFVKKSVSAAMSAATGFILSGFGLNTQLAAAEQSARAVFGVRFTFSVLPIAFILLAIIASFRYRVMPGDYALIKRAIDEKNEKGFAQLTQQEAKTLERVTGMSLDKMWVGQQWKETGLNESANSPT